MAGQSGTHLTSLCIVANPKLVIMKVNWPIIADNKFMNNSFFNGLFTNRTGGIYT